MPRDPHCTNARKIRLTETWEEQSGTTARPNALRTFNWIWIQSSAFRHSVEDHCHCAPYIFGRAVSRQSSRRVTYRKRRQLGRNELPRQLAVPRHYEHMSALWQKARQQVPEAQRSTKVSVYLQQREISIAPYIAQGLGFEPGSKYMVAGN